MKKFHKTVTPPPPRGFMKAYFFLFAIFSEHLTFTLGARFRDKNAIFDVLGDKNNLFHNFMCILSVFCTHYWYFKEIYT